MRRFVYTTVGKLIRARNWLLRPVTVGVRGLVTDAQGNVLLVRHSYGRHWYLPGGGHSGRESLIETLRRELDEELGLTFDCPPRLLGVYSNHHEFKRDFVTVFVISNCTLNPKSNLEIAEWRFFTPSEFPPETSPGTRRRVSEFLGERTIDFIW